MKVKLESLFKAYEYDNEEELDSLLVGTHKGKILGFREGGVNKFFGVPFAKPPINDLRFAPPQEMAGWDDVLICENMRAVATQVEKAPRRFNLSEDCLYMNIWTPKDAIDLKDIPVLVFIHGGAFMEGSPNQPTYDGSRFARDGVIQVNIAYRLNAFGFMGFDEIEEKYGYFANMALLDQIKALEWVQKNIKAFGGDPDNVTLCGQSASSMCISLLLLAEETKGLFNKVIMQSGTSLAQYTIAPRSGGPRDRSEKNTERLMKVVNAASFYDMMKANAHELAENSIFSFDMTDEAPQYFFPVFDGKLIPEIPYDAVVSGHMNDVDLLMGFNSDEGSIFIPDYASEEDYHVAIEHGFGDKADIVKERFPIDEEHSASDRLRYIVKLCLTTSGAKVFADSLTSRGKNVYLYEFSYSTERLKAIGLGAHHSIELGFVFDTLGRGMQEEESMMVKEDVHRRWLNFIKNGNPNGEGDFSVKWPSYNSGDQQIIKLGTDPEIEKFPFTDDVEFLKSVIWE